jgi:hypothetical protein
MHVYWDAGLDAGASAGVAALVLDAGVGTLSGDGASAGSRTARKSGERALPEEGGAFEFDDGGGGKRGELRA